MKKYSIHFFFFFIVVGFAYHDNKSDESFSIFPSKQIDSTLDTVFFYAVALATPFPIGCDSTPTIVDFTKKFKERYFVNCVETTKEIYLKYQKSFDEMTECSPCFLIRVDSSGKKIMEGMAYQDAYVGKVNFYDSTGRIFKSEEWFITEEDSLRFYSNCLGVIDGEVIYYNADGSIKSTEKYSLGTLQKE